MRICLKLRHEQDVTQGQFLSGVLQVWNQFSFTYTGYHTKVKEPILSYLWLEGEEMDL